MTRKPPADLWAHIPGVTYPGHGRFEKIPGVVYPAGAFAHEVRAPKSVPPKRSAQLRGAESLRVAKQGRKLVEGGMTFAAAARHMHMCPKSLDYHMGKHGLRAGARNQAMAVKTFTLTAAMRKKCDELRPHTSWDDISAELGVNRSTLVKYYNLAKGAKK